MNYLTIIVDFCRNDPTLPLALVISSLVYSIVQYRRSPWRKVPPGPKGWPIIGNALELGESRLWLKFKRWREVYGMSPTTRGCSPFGDRHLLPALNCLQAMSSTSMSQDNPSSFSTPPKRHQTSSSGMRETIRVDPATSLARRS